MTIPPIPGFRSVPFTGVIYVMAEAARRGFRYGHPDWCNLGQGQPETGPLPGAPPRLTEVNIGPGDQDYAPIPGLWELRRANWLSRRSLLKGAAYGVGGTVALGAIGLLTFVPGKPIWRMGRTSGLRLMSRRRGRVPVRCTRFWMDI